MVSALRTRGSVWVRLQARVLRMSSSASGQVGAEMVKAGPGTGSPQQMLVSDNATDGEVHLADGRRRSGSAPTPRSVRACPPERGRTSPGPRAVRSGSGTREPPASAAWACGATAWACVPKAARHTGLPTESGSPITCRGRLCVGSPTGHQWCATSITTRGDGWPVVSTNTRNGNRARTPRPSVVWPSKLPAKAACRNVVQPVTSTSSPGSAGV